MREPQFQQLMFFAEKLKQFLESPAYADGGDIPVIADTFSEKRSEAIIHIYAEAVDGCGCSDPVPDVVESADVVQCLLRILVHCDGFRQQVGIEVEHKHKAADLEAQSCTKSEITGAYSGFLHLPFYLLGQKISIFIIDESHRSLESVIFDV